MNGDGTDTQTKDPEKWMGDNWAAIIATDRNYSRARGERIIFIGIFALAGVVTYRVLL